MNKQWVQDRGVWVPAYRALDSGLLVPHDYEPPQWDAYVASSYTFSGIHFAFFNEAEIATILRSQRIGREFDRVIKESWW